MFDPEIEALPFEAQAAIDDVLYRRQVAYLFERSRFYRDKLGEAGFDSPEAVGGLERIAALPITEKDEIRQTRSDDEPVGAHLCVPLRDTVRIFSTSGTTGTPSYIPLTARDIANWTRISARTYASGGIRRGDGLISTYGGGPFVAGITFDAFNLLGVSPHPDRRRQHRAADDDGPAPQAATPSRSPRPMRSTSPNGRASAASTPVRRASRSCWSAASPAAASRRCGSSSRRPGARRSPR